MILRFAPLALIALLLSSAGAQAGPESAPRAPRPPRASSVRPVPPVAPRAPILVDEDEETDTDTTLSVPARSRLVLENFSGDIEVSGWDRNLVRVQADHPSRTRINVAVRPATVVVSAVTRIRLPDLDNRRHAQADYMKALEEVELPSRVSYQLTVPRWMGLALSGLNSSISVEGVEGDVTAEVVNGSVDVRGGRGTIRLGSVNGEVEATGVRGSVEASSVSEGITLRDVQGRVRAESVNGNVELLGIVSEEVEASTVSGDLRYEGALRAGGSYRFESHSGDLTVALPQSPDVTVSVDTYSGEFASSFPVQVSGLKRGKQFDFVLGDGRAELIMKSFSGEILLTRAGVPAKRVRVVGAPKAR